MSCLPFFFPSSFAFISCFHINADNNAVFLLQIWSSSWRHGCSLCPSTSLDMFSCCLSNKQGFFLINQFCFVHKYQKVITTLKHYGQCNFVFFLFSSQLLDFLLGEGHDPLFRRAELKTLLDLHGNEVTIIIKDCITVLDQCIASPRSSSLLLGRKRWRIDTR